ncbi:unnamed protein product [Strongylus vulgaris]|uniref:Uncharacterized protein n=1 Tax=Strongylus vulgaris TaxID=40348 RepID=A0A3P7IUN5_STRVU|nr:unnamed protein product [Strongylus vulgaris]
MAELVEEIETLTRQADDLLGELGLCRVLDIVVPFSELLWVIKKRKEYPYIIAKMKKEEIREMFAHVCESPLLSIPSSDRIDIERLKNNIAAKLDETRFNSERIEDIKKEIEEVKI